MPAVWNFDSIATASRLELTPLEARLTLTKAGYRADEDQLWRLDDSTEARLMSSALERIEATAYENIEAGWQDDFSLDDED